MSLLEERFENNELDALKAMIDLYGKLKDTNFHNLADSIELWIDAYPKKELLQYITDKDDSYYNVLIDIINAKRIRIGIK
ncbi:MAG: hypothetical protein LBU73_07460 [Helicobacteraceae bacterium]|nr:hypothetical protein [Helicobacteraceae bacterium]